MVYSLSAVGFASRNCCGLLESVFWALTRVYKYLPAGLFCKGVCAAIDCVFRLIADVLQVIAVVLQLAVGVCRKWLSFCAMTNY